VADFLVAVVEEVVAVALEQDRYKKIFGEDLEKVFQQKEFLWSIRANILKATVDKIEERFKEKNYQFEKIPWIKEGFWIKAEENLSKTLEHVLGYYFIQNASSMIPPLVLNPKPDETILDMCASPGVKTTHLASLMQNTGLIVANDITYKRLKALRGNLQRCGVSNSVVTKMFGENFWKTDLKFSKILLDSPCTGTGSLNPRILKETSLSSIRTLSKLQKRILISASKCLEENGELVYSTCSLEPEENEENIDFAVKELGLATENIEVNFPFKPAILEWEERKYDDSVDKAVRIIPTNKTEGFFICKLRK
jgi:NOL1/NOP2/sun family putative RNA methylase